MDYGIYIHIPFCIKKCAYCDFNSFPAGELLKEDYLKALLCEIEKDTVLQSGDNITTVFIGGGTPSLLTPAQIEAILKKLPLAEGAEVSMEANPGTVTGAALSGYRSAGINRLSFGVQSFQEEELKRLGRIHTAEDAVKAVELAIQCGYTNINIDLMKDIPGQTTASLKQNVRQALSLGVPHISAYSLIIEENTPFYEAFEKGELEVFSEEASADMDMLLQEELLAAGYNRYEISNFAREGYSCRHNAGYWERKPYRGYGLSAASLIVEGNGDNYRFTAESELSEYISAAGEPLAKRTKAAERLRKLSKKEQMEEFAFLGFRQIKGISEKTFNNCFGISLMSVYGDIINKYMAMGLIKSYRAFEDVYYCLSERGLMISNIILADFLMEE